MKLAAKKSKLSVLSARTCATKTPLGSNLQKYTFNKISFKCLYLITEEFMQKDSSPLQFLHVQLYQRRPCFSENVNAKNKQMPDPVKKIVCIVNV